MRKCKVCKEPHKSKNVWNICSPECGYKLTQVNLEKKKEEKFQKLKRKHRATDLKIRKKAAKYWCHKYIRLRDKDKPCICCGEPLKEGYQAGHWMPSGQNPFIRYDEDNIHGQNLNCNYYKGGDSGDYEKNLIARIGKERVEALKAKKGGQMKRTAQDYKEIEEYYKSKINDIIKG